MQAEVAVVLLFTSNLQIVKIPLSFHKSQAMNFKNTLKI